MNDLITERTFDSQTTWETDVNGFFLEMLSAGVYKLELADVRLTGAGITCLYCRFSIYERDDIREKCRRELLQEKIQIEADTITISLRIG